MLCGIFGPEKSVAYQCKKCKTINPPQAAEGRYNCLQQRKWKDGRWRLCNGIYEVSRGEAEKVMQAVHREELEERNARIKALERAQREALKYRQASVRAPNMKDLPPLPVASLDVHVSRGKGSPAVASASLSRRKATNRRQNQTLGGPWQHSRSARWGEAHINQLNGPSWYHQAPTKHTVIQDPWYR